MISSLVGLLFEFKSIRSLSRPVWDIAVAMIQCRIALSKDDASLRNHLSTLCFKIRGLMELLHTFKKQSKASMLAFMFTDLAYYEVCTQYKSDMKVIKYPGFYVSRPGFTSPENFKKFLAGELEFMLTHEEAADLAAGE